MEDDDGYRGDSICSGRGDDEFPSLFQRVAGSSSGQQSGLSAAGGAAPDSSGGSCGGGGIHRHRAIWRAEDRTAAAISALRKRHALARSSRRYLCHARRPRLPALLRGLGGGADEHTRRGDLDRWQDVAALVSDQGLERGDPHRLCLRRAATHRAGPGKGEREVERDRRHPGAARHDVDRGRGRDDRCDGLPA